jgi:hypothetical protein
MYIYTHIYICIYRPIDIAIKFSSKHCIKIILQPRRAYITHLEKHWLGTLNLKQSCLLKHFSASTGVLCMPGAKNSEITKTAHSPVGKTN